MKIQNFDRWMNIVDRIIYKLLKMHLEDLPDELYRDAYDHDTSPIEMARIIISHNMF